MHSPFRKLFSVFLFLFFVFSVQAQFSNIDSCLKELPHCGEDTNKVLLLNSISWDTSFQNLKAAMAYAEQGLVLARQLNYKKGLAELNLTMGAVYMDMGRYFS